MEIVRAKASDAEAIHALRMLVFAQVAEDYADPELPPLAEGLPEARAEFETHVVLKAVEGGRIVGAVRASVRDGVVLIARLVVDPGLEGRGIGTALAQAVEDAFPQARRFELFTGHKSRPSLAIWSKLGYREDRREPVGRYELVYLSKDV
jgi:GNAT superfamily N-acetyltransferase